MYFEYDAVHPYWTFTEVLHIDCPLFVVVSHKTSQVLDSVRFYASILQNYSAENAVFLVLGVSHLVHEVILCFVFVHETHYIGIKDGFYHVLAVTAGGKVDSIHFHFVQNTHTLDRHVVKVT